MTWASVSFEHKCPSEGDFLLRYAESMSEPELLLYWRKQTGSELLHKVSELLLEETICEMN